MAIRSFYTALLLVTLVDAATLWVLYHFNSIQSGFFPIFGILFFFSFSVLIFHLGRSSAMSSDKNRFTSVVMSMIFLKLVLTLVIVLTYDRLVNKVHMHHIASFLVSYLFFTIYEVYFMSKLARWHI